MERFRVHVSDFIPAVLFRVACLWIVFSPFLRLMMHELSCPPIPRLFLFSFLFRFHLCAPCLVGSACCKKFFYEASVLMNRSCRTCFWGLFHYAFCRLTTVQHAKLLVIISLFLSSPKLPSFTLYPISMRDFCGACSPIRSLGFRTTSLMSQVSIKFILILFAPLFFLFLSLTCSLLSLDRWRDVKRQAACAKFYLPSFFPLGWWSIRGVSGSQLLHAFILVSTRHD